MNSTAQQSNGTVSQPMHPLPPRTRIQAAGREELMEGVLGVMRRTWRGREINRMKARLQQLDMRALREVAFRHGAFEQDEWNMTF
jgi:hypothetical protein